MSGSQFSPPAPKPWPPLPSGTGRPAWARKRPAALSVRGSTGGHAGAPPHEQRGLRERYLVRPVRSNNPVTAGSSTACGRPSLSMSRPESGGRIDLDAVGERRVSDGAGVPARGALGDLFPRPGFGQVAQQRRRGALGAEHAAVDGDQRGLLLVGQALLGADGRLHRRCWGPVSRRGPIPGGSQVEQAGLGK